MGGIREQILCFRVNTSDRKHFSSTYPLSIVPAQTKVLGCMFVCVGGGGGGVK